jgi:hypothetical protein
MVVAPLQAVLSQLFSIPDKLSRADITPWSLSNQWVPLTFFLYLTWPVCFYAILYPGSSDAKNAYVYEVPFSSKSDFYDDVLFFLAPDDTSIPSVSSTLACHFPHTSVRMHRSHPHVSPHLSSLPISHLLYFMLTCHRFTSGLHQL